MSSAAPARRVALDLVGQARRRDARARDLMRESPEMDRLTARDRGLVTRLVLGSTSTRGELDRRIRSYVAKPSHLEPRVADALAIAAFELLYLSTPQQVAVSQGVELVRSVAPRAAGLANAVLRKLSANDRAQVDAAHSHVGAREANACDLAVAGGFPTWLVAELIGSCGFDGACDIAESQLDPPPVYVASNVALHTTDEASRILAKAGLEPVPTPLPSAMRLSKPAGLSRSGLVEGADVVIADLAAQLVCLIATPEPGQTLLEIGQGRASKTLLIESDAMALGGPVEATCIDSVPSKVRIATERVGHGWAEHVRELCFDATKLAGTVLDPLPPELDRGFDVVIVDAPCSGTGTMRRHPEIPWSLDAKSLDASKDDSLVSLQRDMLEAASSRVTPGGYLVYATCSVLAEEDEQVVDGFLGSPAGSGFELVSVLEAPAVKVAQAQTQEYLASLVTERGLLHAYPTQDGPDGHFCAMLRRAR